MNLINTIIFTCPTCGTVMKFPVSAINNKLENTEYAYELTCEMCGYSMNSMRTPNSSSDRSVLSGFVDTINKYNGTVTAIKLLQSTSILNFE